ncbi:hypothetical protein VTJ49DRAFT_3484 [Mycothermus thermophilus]|uniref:MARVEL domain-containing protein n=1 Tax=Humicola insolens TaxID=85995 RepID=A0ABR3VMQ8_HUMIN
MKLPTMKLPSMKFPAMKTKLPTFPLNRVVRTMQAMFALLVLVLSASGKIAWGDKITRWYHAMTPLPTPAQTTFLLAVAAWSLISLIAIELLPRFLPQVPRSHLTLPFDLTNTLFYLGGLAALAVFMSQLVVCWTFVCLAAQADVAAAAASFAFWSASAFLTVRDMIKDRRVLAAARRAEEKGVA